MIGVRNGIDEYGQPAEEILSGYVGEFKYFGFESVPPHCLACDGSEVSRETYSELFAVFGTMYGAGNGATTFNLPDLRGAFLRCIGGNAAELGAEQGDAIRNITGQWEIRSGSGNQDVLNVSASATALYQATRDGNSYNTLSVVSTDNNPHQIVDFDASRVVPTAAEVRPVNVAVNICVVFE